MQDAGVVDRGSGPMWPLLVGCLALAALTLILPSTPTYDPWAWILWGREIGHLDLLTDGGPSWKPLPVLFTVPFSIFGDHAAPLLWVWIARAGGLLAVAMAFRVARRLVGGAAGLVGGLFGALFLLSSFRFVRDGALGNSEAMLAGLVLWGYERHLDGRRDHALYLGVAAALLRPEVWPFLGIYGIWLFLHEPELRPRLLGFGVLVPALWGGPELWGSGDALRASSRANTPNPGSPAFAEHPGWEVISRFIRVTIPALQATALVGTLCAAYAWMRTRRQRHVLVVGLAGLAWLLLVAGMTEGGYAGNQRYLIVSTACVCVLGGVGVGRIFQGLQGLAARLTQDRRVALGIAFGVVALAAVAAAPVWEKRVDNVRVTVDLLRYEADLWSGLRDAIDEAGGADRLKACGHLYSGPFQTQMVAYELGVHGRDISPLRSTPPGAAFRTRTIPKGPLVIRPRDPRYREVVATEHWRIATVPPAGKPRSAVSGCPASGPGAPEAPVTSQNGHRDSASRPAD